MFKKKKFKNLLHSQSSMGPIVSMDLALAVASFKVSQIMGLVNSVNSFEIFTLNVMLVRLRIDFNFKIIFIIIIFPGPKPADLDSESTQVEVHDEVVLHAREDYTLAQLNLALSHKLMNL